MAVSSIVQEHIQGLIKSFVKDSMQEQLLAIASDPTSHGEMLNLLFHRGTLGTHWARKITATSRDTETIKRLLIASGAGDTCLVISTSPDADGQLLPLDEALSKYTGAGSTMFLSCSPGELVYFEDEQTDERYVFSTRDGTASFF